MSAHHTPIRSADNIANPDWWRGAVIYQVYPRSFQDSNGDGIGDLAGITARLPHIASLGVDAVWVSPFLKSPMKDFGYDVSDYRDVDPIFGTLADFDALVARAHELGLRVIIDLAWSHTSDAHPWFGESRTDTKNPKADWYVWAPPKPDGGPPNNWLAVFGGPAWQWDSRRQQYYLHNFLASQPDLNFHNRQVQDALLDIARFWLERGVDGFRLDTINFYFHDTELRDNPPLDRSLRNATIAPQVNPYNHQRHLYDKNQPENIAFLRRLRAVLQPFGAAALGEVGDAQQGLEIMGRYTAGDDLVHMCYAFEMLANHTVRAADIAAVMDRVADLVANGWACWAFSNHDTQRHASRWRLPPEGLKAMAALMMCWRGSACIYQGEELGLGEADVAFEDLRDPYGIEFWPEFKGRDGCRTPMAWDAHAPHAGFSDAAPWLPVDPHHAQMAVALQEGDAASMLHHYRAAVALRRRHAALRTGAQSKMTARGDVLTFSRSGGGETVFCAFNLSGMAQLLDAPGGTGWTCLGEKLGAAQIDPQAGAARKAGAACKADAPCRVRLAPWQCLIMARREGDSSG